MVPPCAFKQYTIETLYQSVAAALVGDVHPRRVGGFATETVDEATAAGRISF